MNLPEIRLAKTHYIMLGLAFAVFIGWRVYAAVHPTVREERPVPVVRTITIGETVSDEKAVYPGEVRGKYESTLAFQVPGKIVARHINLGDAVRAGQVLMEIDPQDIEQNHNAAQAAYQAALSNYELAKDNYGRFSALHDKGAVSTMARDQYKTQLDAAESSLKSAQAQLTASRNQLEYTRLKADHDGIVSAIAGEIGQVTAAGTPMVTVVQDGSREIQIFIPENRLDRIHPGQPAVITFWALNDITASGHISEIAPMADAVTRTYKVRVAVDAMPEQARLGMTAKVTLQSGSESTVTVPAGAIYQTGEQAQVWVIRDRKAALVSVKTAGYEGSSSIRITEGLTKGDIVVTGGINKLSEGQEVRLESSEAK